MKDAKIWGSCDPFYEGGALMGRKVANEEFLGALLRMDPFDEYHFFLSSQALRESFARTLGKRHPGLKESGRVRLFLRADLPRMLSGHDYYCFHQSDCINCPPHLIRLRNMYSRGAFPVTGPIHSLSYEPFMERFLAWMWAGTTPRDAVVCTSSRGREAVRRFFSSLRDGFGLGAGRFREPDCPLIPLGVDTGRMVPPEREEREAARLKLGVSPEEIAVLVFGRMEHYSKMDFLPLFRAMARVFESGVPRDRVRLILGGWADEKDSLVPTFSDLARNLGLSLTVRTCPPEEEKRELFQAADLFVSIADNPQETFGITILEAGAFGMPVIASEYDGYRDLIADGETGVLIPVTGPAATDGIDALAPLLFDNQYHLLLAQQTAVDVPALAEALTGLIRDEGKRKAMGLAARQRVKDNYSWERVVEMHLSLWEALWVREVDIEPLRDVRHPLHLPFAHVFGGYPSQTLEPDAAFVWSRAGQAVYRGADFPVIYEGVYGHVAPDSVKALLFGARKPVSAAALASGVCRRFPDLSPEGASFLILWALKHDLLERV